VDDAGLKEILTCIGSEYNWTPDVKSACDIEEIRWDSEKENYALIIKQAYRGPHWTERMHEVVQRVQIQDE